MGGVNSMKGKVGSKVWFIADGYYPTISNGHFPSHESICVLNTNEIDANINITLYFEDRIKMDGFRVICGAERTNHIRMDKLKDKDNNGVPQGIPYAIMVTSDVDVIVQYSRMDTTQAEMALMTTMGFPLT